MPLHRVVVAVALAAGMGCASGASYAAPKGAHPAADAPYSWTGFYAGVSGGYGWNKGSNSLTGIDAFGLYKASIGPPPTAPFPDSIDSASKGVLGGATVGYNYQIGQSVLGVEADFSKSNIRGSNSFVSADFGVFAPITTTQQDKKLEWLSTLRARVGYLPTPALLVFATGGLAFGKGSASTSTTVTPSPTGGFPADCIAGSPAANFYCNTGSGERTMTGWTLGAGFEAMIAQNWSLKAEYLYYDLGTITYTTATTVLFAGTPALQTSARFNGSIARVGVNYHF